MNILRSFTETVVTTPTDIFPISFEYDEKYDAVHVFLNDVAVEDLGYTVSQVNAVTLKIEPAIPEGTVRIERETDIDKMKYIFDAGALFIDQNVDADFRQIVHSQQEVRDGFIKLRGDVLPLVHGLQEALKQAQEASDAAKEAAKAAEEAAALVSGAVTSVKTIADLKALPTWDGRVVVMQGHTELGKKSTIFRYDATNTDPHNNYSVVKPNTGTGNWLALDTAVYESSQLGCGIAITNNDVLINPLLATSGSITIREELPTTNSINVQSYNDIRGLGTRAGFKYNGPSGTADTLEGRLPVVKLFKDNAKAVSQSRLENLTIHANYKPYVTAVDARYLTGQSKLRELIIRGVTDTSVGLVLNKMWYDKISDVFISGYDPSKPDGSRWGTGVVIESKYSSDPASPDYGAQINALTVDVSCHSLKVGYLIRPNNYIYGLNINTMPTVENCDIGFKMESAPASVDYQVRQSCISAYFENNGIDIQWGTPSTTKARNSKHVWLNCSFDDVHSRIELYEGHHTFIGCKGIKTLVCGQYAQAELINTARPTTITDDYGNVTVRQDPMSQITSGSYQNVRTRSQGMLKLKATVNAGATGTFDLGSVLNTTIASEGQTGLVRILSRRSYDTAPVIAQGVILRKPTGTTFTPIGTVPTGMTISIAGTVLSVSETRGDTKFLDIIFNPD
ncbi:tail spike protein [Acinetobacter phage vB_AbaP_ABW311]